ncbi:MAG: O-antigen ligase family protein [Paracoccaceae bacterium]
MIAVSRWLGWGMMAGLAVLLILVEPHLSAVLPRGLWDAVGLAETPVRGLALVLGLAALLLLLRNRLRRAADWQSVSLVLLFVTSQLNGIGLGPLDLFDIALFGIFFYWLGTSALDENRSFVLPPLIWLAGLIIVIAIAHMPVMNPVSWVLGLFGLVRVFLLAVLVIDICRTPERLERALQLFLVVALMSAVVGIAQFCLAYWNIFFFTLIDPPISAFKPTPVGFVMRASGFCITAQHFSSFLIYALPVALWQASNRLSLWSILQIVILLTGIVVSWNTGGMLTALAMLIVFPLLRWPEKLIHVVLIGMTVLAAAFYAGVLELVYDATFGDAGVAKGVDQRKTLMELGIEQIGLNPIVGSGVRGFGVVDGNFWGRPVHNVLFQVMAELGLIATLVLLSIFFVLTVETVRLYNKPGARVFAVYCALALLGVTILSQSEPNIDQSNLWLVLSLIQASAVVFSRRPEDAPFSEFAAARETRVERLR